MSFLHFGEKIIFVNIVFQGFLILSRDQCQSERKELNLICNRGFYNDPLLDWSNYRAAIQN